MHLLAKNEHARREAGHVVSLADFRFAAYLK